MLLTLIDNKLFTSEFRERQQLSGGARRPVVQLVQHDLLVSIKEI